jgi:tetratricopeptide (TPR) repeat protein
VTLKIIRTSPVIGRAVIVFLTVVTLLSGWMLARWYAVHTLAARADAARADARYIAEWLSEAGSSDPRARFASASLLEKTFEPGDLERAVVEYEAAAALTPHNYGVWISLARARGLKGDQQGAEAAYRRAHELAPNYSATQWALGNFLVRSGQVDEGFDLIARAAAADQQLAGPAVTLAFQIFEGDVGRITGTLGRGQSVSAALTGALSIGKRFDDAVNTWSTMEAKDKTLGGTLRDQLIAAGEYRKAVAVASDITPDGLEKPTIGKITNGGFEFAVKPRESPAFDWQIQEGAQPQIGLNNAQSHSGTFSLLMAFNTTEPAGFRQVWQLVAVEPGSTYEVEMKYRSDLKTNLEYKWEVVDAKTQSVIASTAPVAPTGDWATLRAQFTAPQSTDGLIVRISRVGCVAMTCPVVGRLLFDDIVLRRLASAVGQQ